MNMQNIETEISQKPPSSPLRIVIFVSLFVVMLALCVGISGQLYKFITMVAAAFMAGSDPAKAGAIMKSMAWLIDGMVSLDRFREFFDLSDVTLPGEDTGNIHTLGGVMMFALGRVPVVTDRFDWDGFTFEIMDMDKTRVDKIMVVRHPQSVMQMNDS